MPKSKHKIEYEKSLMMTNNLYFYDKSEGQWKSRENGTVKVNDVDRQICNYIINVCANSKCRRNCLKRFNHNHRTLQKVSSLVRFMFQQTENDLKDLLYYLVGPCKRTVPPLIFGSNDRNNSYMKLCRDCFEKVFPLTKRITKGGMNNIGNFSDRKKCLDNIGTLFQRVHNKEETHKIPAMVVSGSFVQEKRTSGCRVIELKPVEVIDGRELKYSFVNDDFADDDTIEISGESMIVFAEYWTRQINLDVSYHYIHNNKGHIETNFIVLALVTEIPKNEEIVMDAEALAKSYSNHKNNIVEEGKHNQSSGSYYAHGLKADYSRTGGGTSIGPQASIGQYAYKREPDDEFLQHLKGIKATINCANNAIRCSLGVEEDIDIVKIIAGNIEAEATLVNDLYFLSSLSQKHKVEAIQYELESLQWGSLNVCIDALTRLYHKENDLSNTMIARPYFLQKCISKTTTFNFDVAGKELKIPLSEGKVILFIAHLLKHRQECPEIEQNNKSVKGGDDDHFINISCYSNRQFAHKLAATLTRLYNAAMQQFLGVGL